MSTSIKILLVDDMPIIMEIIISHLQEMGLNFTYLKANNGRDACKIAKSSQPDLIIMDWEMPQMNGIDALNLIKKKESTKHIPVIISSGFSDSENVRKALESGAIDYIRKPIDPVELIARVRSVLALNSSFNALKQKQEELELERHKVEKILQSMIPDKIFQELKATGHSKPRRYKNTTIMFADLVSFTKKTSSMSPKRLIDEINDIFSSFDKIVSKNNCIRIKTIGDTYLAVSGVPDQNENHAVDMINTAIEFRNYIIERNKKRPISWEITIGINSGDLIGSLIGLNNYLFDVFGENVNTAARIQGQCKPMNIAINHSTYKLVHNLYSFENKGLISLKGINNANIYNVLNQISIKNNNPQSSQQSKLEEVVLKNRLS
jgi:DNA-binding response OmpR family regulator